MPRRRTQSQTRGLVLGTAGVLVGLLLLLGLSWAAGEDKVDLSNIADEHQKIGDAQRLASRIATDGPFILPDLSPAKHRVVFVQHVGPAPTAGWHTILAGTKRCPVEWLPDTREFRDTCTGDLYDEDGAGLTRYRTWVQGGEVIVDLRTTVD